MEKENPFQENLLKQKDHKKYASLLSLLLFSFLSSLLSESEFMGTPGERFSCLQNGLVTDVKQP